MFFQGKPFLHLLCWIILNSGSNKEGKPTKIRVYVHRERENRNWSERLNIAKHGAIQTRLCDREKFSYNLSNLL